MTEGDFLDDVMNEASIEAPVEAPEPVIEAPATVRDEKGRFAPKGETESASPAPVTEPALDHAAVVGERRRRQEAEARAQALEAQLQSLQQPPAPPPSIWEDEEGARQHDRSQAVSEAVQQATFNARLDMSEMMVRQANPDFEEVKAEFLRLAEDNPALRQQALADPHPWNKAYQIAKNHKRMTELGATDLDSLRAKIREEVMAEFQATPAAAPTSIPTSLADAQSARISNAQPASLTLKDILGR